MDIPKTCKEVIARFKQAPDEIQKYFTPSVELIERYPWEVTLAYSGNCSRPFLGNP